MKKLILLLFLITGSLKVQAQFCGEAKGDQPSSEIKTNFYFDTDDKGVPIKVPIYKWMDRFGNRYADLQIKDKRNKASKSVPTFGFTNPDCQSQGGLFNVFVEDIQNATGTGFDLTANSQMLTVICQVFDDLDVLLNQQASTCSGVTKSGVNIRLRSFNDPSSGVLGSASSFYESEGELNGIKHGEVWKAINTGYNDGDRWDGFININLGYSNWYSGFGSTPSGQVDLYTVMLHEVLHSLGFASLINSNGDSKFLGNGVDSYSPYDTFLTSDNNTDLLINTSGYNWDFNSANPISILTSGCGVSGANIEFRGNFNAPLSPVHAAASWSGGSSISHFESNCDSYGNTADYVMNPGIATGVSRSLTQEEIDTLGDLGYQLNNVYGTNTLANSNSNPRQHNNFTSPNVTSLVATDDYGPCCSNTNYSVEACNGNTLSISITDLLCNDIQSNSNVILVEDLATNTAVTISGSNIIYTPSGAGTQALRYLLEDSNGNQSNYAYIYIDVFPCAGFNCTNTDDCNLICNPEFDDGGDCSNITTNCRRQISTGGCSGGLSSVDGWYPIVGTPDSVLGNCTTTNINSLPSVSGNEHLFLWDGSNYEEGMMTAVQVDPTKNYILSYHRAEGMGSNLNHQLDVFLTNLSQVTWFPNPGPNASGSSIPANQELLIADQFNSANWEQTIQCFSPSQAYDILYFRTSSFGNSLSGVLLDQIELVEDRLQEIQQNYLLGCQETVVLGEALCDITNMEYSWWDVTNSSSPVQLTQGATVVNGNVSIPNGSNGSELEINATQNTTFELRRNFVSSNGIAIANNNCNASVQVQVIVDLDITLTKEVIGGSAVGAGAPVTYQITVTNNTGYPINNLDITDVLASNFNVGTLNVNPNGNVTTSNSGNTVTFTVLNLVDGASEQIIFDVVINGNIDDIVTNCASLEYLDCPLESCVDVEIKDGCEIIAPTNLQVVGNTLTWDPVPGATGYIITSPGGNVPQIDCGCDGSNGVSIAPVTVNTNSYTLPASLTNSCFVWQVTAICGNGEKSPISDQACYTPKKSECEITAPINLQVVGNTLTWDPVPGASGYIITSPGGNVPQIDCGCDGSNGISLAPITVNTNSYTLPASLTNSCFVWQVTAICENGEKSPISDQACYTPKKSECEVTAPINLQVVGNTLTWDPVPGASGYIITSPGGNVPQIDCGCDGSNGISLAPITINTNSYTLPTSLTNSCFVWQVTAICESGEKSPISNQACYTPKKSECEVTAPTNLQVVGNTLTWDPVPGAIGYIITSPAGNVPQIDCGCNGNNGVSIAPVNVNTNSYTLPASLTDKCFVWQVTAICKSKEKSPISNQACYTPKEEKCEATAPINLQVVGNTLTWNPVPGAIGYIITSPAGNVPQIDCGCNGSNGVSIAPVTVSTNSYTLPASLADKCFVWQVTAICKSGEKSPISNQACYTPKEEKCEATTPTNLQVVGNTLTWNPVPGATSYIILSPAGNVPQIDCGCSGSNGVSIAPVTVNTNSYTLPASLADKCFVWQVIAICESGEKSPISNQACYKGSKKGEKDVISIYPNPNKGDMNIKIDTNNDSNVILNVYQFDGTLIKTINNLKPQRGHLDFNLNLQSRLNSGIYFFVFNIGDHTISKKVIIE